MPKGEEKNKELEKRLDRFSKQLSVTTREIEKASLLLKKSHLEKLKKTLFYFSEYRIGKATLKDFRNGDFYENKSVEDLIIMQNGGNKVIYETLLDEILEDFSKTIEE